MLWAPVCPQLATRQYCVSSESSFRCTCGFASTFARKGNPCDSLLTRSSLPVCNPARLGHEAVHLLQQSIAHHKLAIVARSLLYPRLCYRAMSTYSLAEAITPSRKAVPPRKAKGRKGGDIELPDYISPEPKNAAERRDWDRMSSRMEGVCFLSLWLREGVSVLNRHCLFTGFHTYCQSFFVLCGQAAERAAQSTLTPLSSRQQSVHPSSSFSSWRTVPLPSMACL